jgi:hypothetical protein
MCAHYSDDTKTIFQGGQAHSKFLKSFDFPYYYLTYLKNGLKKIIQFFNKYLYIFFTRVELRYLGQFLVSDFFT